jgi:hypothetical protein
MANKKILLGILVMVLVFGMTVVGCDNGTTEKEETDTWTVVVSLSQLHGTWKGALSQTSTMQEFFGEEWDTMAENIFGTNMKVSMSGLYTYTFNAVAETFALFSEVTLAFSGGKISTSWEPIKSELSSLASSEISMYFNDTNRSVLVYTNIPATDISGVTWSFVQINQYGTKIKYPIDMMGTVGEAILTKQ